jgi:phosphoglycolate phosphatase-like HAD superfamily hydrolase
MAVQHIVWDWNGTLFADQPIVLAAVNDALSAVGVPPISPAEYRRLSKRPVRPFYAAIAGRPLTDGEWETIDESYHVAYLERLEDAALDRHAVEALTWGAAAGLSQSLLSMWPHDELIPLVRRHGIERFFCRIDGFRGECGGEKAEHLAEHLAALATDLGLAPGLAAVVGDSVDDATAATACGAHPVLMETATYDRDLLERVPDAAVVADLPDCVRHLAGLGGDREPGGPDTDRDRPRVQGAGT